MKKIAIIGSGIIGMTCATYLSKENIEVTVFDSGIGQATSASAGIISPWLSKRRNKKWYHLAKDGAHFFQKLAIDFSLPEQVYQKSGSLILRKPDELALLAALAEERKKEAPEIGQIALLSSTQTKQILPLLKEQPALKISGGARLDGKAYLNHLRKIAQMNHVSFVHEQVSLRKTTNGWLIKGLFGEKEVDQVVAACGPFLKNLLSPLGYDVDVRPQKGQLLVFETSLSDTARWPVVMLDGEADRSLRLVSQGH